MRLRFAFHLVLMFLVSAFGAQSSAVSDSQEVAAGTLPGTFEVDSSGAANYRFDIEVPPGTSGMQPRLSVRYNSQSGNSMLGKGWRLSGLSSIGRCPSTLSQDGLRRGVAYDAGDRFCVDGQRLVAVNGGAYGAEGTEYRTEKESWNRYYSHGACGSGPCEFSLTTPEGFAVVYGGDDDSRIMASGKPEVRIWAVSLKTDKNSNFLRITYASDEGTGAYYPDRVSYTGNSRTGLKPQRQVVFTYENRPDTSSAYLAGSRVEKNRRLSAITAFLDDQAVREYRFAYRTSDTTGASLLSAVRECDGGGICLAPTVFAWGNDLSVSTGFELQSWGTLSRWTNGSRFNAGDFNGDGQSDLAYAFNDSGSLSIEAFLSTGEAFRPASWYRGDNHWEDGLFTAADFNGDGLTDLAFAFNDAGYLVIDLYLSEQSGFRRAPGQRGSLRWQNGLQVEPGDFNGDGLSDLLVTGNDAGTLAASVYLSRGDELVADAAFSAASIRWSTDAVARVADLNGDGVTDVAYALNNSGFLGVFRLISTGVAFEAPQLVETELRWSQDQLLSLSDYNNDGLTDLSLFYNDAGAVSVSVLLSSGDGFEVRDWSRTQLPWQSQDFIKSGDFNGDGLVDVSYIYRDSGLTVSIQTYLSTGSGFVPYQTFSRRGGWSNELFIPSDFDGNGSADIATPYNDGGRIGFAVYAAEDGSAVEHDLPPDRRRDLSASRRARRVPER